MGLSQDNKGERNRSQSNVIIRLANDLQACMGYKGTYMRDQLANEMTGVRRT